MMDSGNSKSGEPDSRQAPDTPIKSVLSIALIGPDDYRRKAFLSALSQHQGAEVHEFTSLPPDLDQLPRTVGDRYDVVILDVDSDPDYVFNLVERISAGTPTCVMVYSAEADVKQAVRFMRAGAREYFTLPLVPTEVAGALKRAAMQQSNQSQAARTAGQVFAFLGAKGGCGVTSIAANFAVHVAQQSGQSTLLIDFGQPLGDAAINLGMSTFEYSTASAFQDSSRLDARFLMSLVSKHDSGLSVLAAPGDFPSEQPTTEAVDKLIDVAQQVFTYIVVDIGSRTDLMESALFGESSVVYLVTQVGISELRNSNRIINRYLSLRSHNLQIVLNRYTAKSLLFDESQITKALTREPDWKIPDDYATARRTENTGSAIALANSPISLALRKMARTACGLGEEQSKKKGFSFFRK
jgi:pilus assembly protein CpaE